ncbi:sensor histidine kinase [Bordetella sp. 2513F-2]
MCELPHTMPSFPFPRPVSLRLLLALMALILSALALLAVGQWASRHALLELSRQATNTAQLNTLALRSYLERFRAVPRVLAEDSDVRQALRQPGRPAGVAALDGRLERLNRDVGASVIYLLGADGVAIAASNWLEPTSFVGVDYRFRPYFQQAVQAGSAEYFALGTVSRQPGLYLSRRIDDPDGTLLGVIVLKMEFAVLERDWRRLPALIYLTDPNGVVLMGSVPSWRFRAVAPLPENTSRLLQASRQFGSAAFAPMPLSRLDGGADAAQLVRTEEPLPGLPAGSTLLDLAQPVADTPGWTLHLLVPAMRPMRQAAANARLYTFLVLATVAALCALIYQRRRRTRRRAEDQARRNAELEAQVRQRTLQLDLANRQLMAQMDERQRAEARLHQMQEDLVQSNKLALLGQVAAGVAHEINQPLAAIRNYADNAVRFLQRADTGTAQDNLHRIARLTDRIGRITGELRTFSRKSSTRVAEVPLAPVLEGAMMLVSPRISRDRVKLDYAAPPAALHVMADRARLEQVFVNLLQNALEAMAAQPAAEARIRVTVSATAGQVDISIADTGPGLSADVRTRLFTPFHTTKPEGLGLGLVISRDILAELGGSLAAAPTEPGSGACFIVTLRRAPAGAATA